MTFYPLRSPLVLALALVGLFSADAMAGHAAKIRTNVRNLKTAGLGAKLLSLPSCKVKVKQYEIYASGLTVQSAQRIGSTSNAEIRLKCHLSGKCVLDGHTEKRIATIRLPYAKMNDAKLNFMQLGSNCAKSRRQSVAPAGRANIRALDRAFGSIYKVYDRNRCMIEVGGYKVDAWNLKEARPDGPNAVKLVCLDNKCIWKRRTQQKMILRMPNVLNPAVIKTKFDAVRRECSRHIK